MIKLENPTLAKLLKSPNYPRMLSIVESVKPLAPRRVKDSESVLWHAALRGALGPSNSEKMTRQERTRLAATIRRAAAELRESLGQVLIDDQMPYQFQSGLDGMALDAINSFAEKFGEPQRKQMEEDDTLHHGRFAIYHLLMQGIPNVLEVIEESAAWWDSEEQYLAKPNHPNAARLYFIRRATEIFYVEFGKPMRELTLELTSVFFDCSDLSEADLSKLAPVRNIHHPFLRSADQSGDKL